MRVRHLAPSLVALVSFLLPFHVSVAQKFAPAGQDGGAAAPYASDPKFQSTMAEGALLAKHKHYFFAADSFKKANKLAGGRCVACLHDLYSAEMGGALFKDAAATAETLEALATVPDVKSLEEVRRAAALYEGAGEKPKPEKLTAIHGILLEALGNHPRNASALYLDGQVMARLGQMEEAKSDFAKCVACVSPTDPARLRAEHFAENPELALHKMAPAFEVTALDGSRFNLDAMGGRVVLIDFWATWCGPCNRELPHMKQIAKEFAGQPLVIISVSWDSDEAKWKEFVAKNGMDWVQYRDADHHLAEAFGINSIPHYFTIDSDGVLTSEMLGEGVDVESRLKKLLAKAQTAKRETLANVPTPQLPLGN